MRKLFLAFSMAVLIATPAFAKIQTEVVEYKQGDTTLEGYLVYDSEWQNKHPGVLIVHDWMGVGEYVKTRAEQVARLGYVVFAADIYGKGVRPKNTDEASQQASLYKGNRALLRDRVNAAFDILKNQKNVDSMKTAAIGYCFGGTSVLELARSGADVSGVVSFHGSLNTPTPEDAKNIKAKVLVLHGADDPFVKSEEVKAFEEEMKKVPKVDWQLVKYSGAVHSFTRPDAGNDNSKGAAYNEKADKRSWEAMKQFFNEIFKQ